MTAPGALIDAAELARMLNARALQLCIELLPHGRKEGREWSARCPWRGDGKPGSFKVSISGAKAGVWADFATHEGGDALDLVAAILFHGDKKPAFRWARSWLGMGGDPASIDAVRQATPTPTQLDERQELADEDARAAARRMWLTAQPAIRDTPVDRYLAARGIRLADLGRSPGALRYHPRLWHAETQTHWPAMVAAIARLDGRGVIACHRTWLEVLDDGTVRKAPITPAKKVIGRYKGAHISLARGASGKPYREAPAEILDVTEGIEDGLSVAVANPEARVVAAISLSNLAALEVPPQLTVLRIWRQNDTAAAAIAAFDRGLRAHMHAGRTVLIPPIPEAYKDANDWLRAADA